MSCVLSLGHAFCELVLFRVGNGAFFIGLPFPICLIKIMHFGNYSLILVLLLQIFEIISVVENVHGNLMSVEMPCLMPVCSLGAFWLERRWHFQTCFPLKFAPSGDRLIVRQ